MMRTLLLLLLFCPPLLCIRLVGAQPNSHAALEDFRERFPQADQLVQTQTNQHFRFAFEENGSYKQATYTLLGEWESTLTLIPKEQLPASIKTDLRHNSRGRVQLVYRLESRQFYAPLYLSFVKGKDWEPQPYFPPYALAGTYLKLGGVPTACLISRAGISQLNHRQSRFVVLMHHGSGRGLASHEVQRLLQQAMIPLPLEDFPLSGKLPQTDVLPAGWYACEWGW